MPSILWKRLVERMLRVTPVIGAGVVLICAWLVAFAPLGLMFEDARLIVVPFLTLYTLLFLLSLLGMDVSEDPEPKDDLDHLLSIKRTIGFPIRPHRAGVRRYARPPDELIDVLFHR
jgi:hypothetical protein